MDTTLKQTNSIDFQDANTIETERPIADPARYWGRRVAVMCVAFLTGIVLVGVVRQTPAALPIIVAFSPETLSPNLPGLTLESRADGTHIYNGESGVLTQRFWSGGHRQFDQLAKGFVGSGWLAGPVPTMINAERDFRTQSFEKSGRIRMLWTDNDRVMVIEGRTSSVAGFIGSYNEALASLQIHSFKVGASARS